MRFCPERKVGIGGARRRFLSDSCPVVTTCTCATHLAYRDLVSFMVLLRGRWGRWWRQRQAWDSVAFSAASHPSLTQPAPSPSSITHHHPSHRPPATKVYLPHESRRHTHLQNLRSKSIATLSNFARDQWHLERSGLSSADSGDGQESTSSFFNKWRGISHPVFPTPER